jgi:uncharacterized surface protein with fasciclin (FAS1) repeats
METQMRAHKLVTIMIAIMLMTGIVYSVSSQEVTPEATPETTTTPESTEETPEATVEMTPEATSTVTPTSQSTDAAPTEITPEATQLAEDQQAHIRVAHFSPDAPAVDVYVNGELQDEWTNLAFPDVSDWFTVPSDSSVVIDVAPTGTSANDAVINGIQLDLVPSAWITAAVIGSAENGTLMLDVFQEDYSELLPGTGGITFYNAIEGSNPVNIIRDEEVYAAQLTYPGSLEGAFALVSVLEDAGDYVLRAEETQNPDRVLFDLPDVGIPENAYTFIALVGTPDEPQVVVETTSRAVVDMELGRLQEPGTLMDAIESNFNLTMLADTLETAGLAGMLRDEEGPFTLFLPANFVIDGMQLPEGDALTELLENHVVEGLYHLSDLIDEGTLTTVGGQELTVTVEGNMVLVNGVQIVTPNVAATNGVIHILNAVMTTSED